ncbi:hypothetical protein AAMO2058_001085900 [Amorphochlora amoebiformis]
MADSGVGRNKLIIQAITAKGLKAKKKIAKFSPYLKVVMRDAKERKKQKTSVVKNTVAPVWNESLTFLGVHEDFPEIKLVVAQYSKFGKSKPMGTHKLDIEEFDPRGNPKELWLDLQPGPGRVHVEVSWKCPEQARIQEEERKRRAEERRKMLEKAWKGLQKHFADFLEKPAGPTECGEGVEGKRVGPTIQWARQRLKEIDKFLAGVDKRCRQHPDHLEPKVPPLLKKASPIIVESCMQIFETLTAMKQKDFIGFLKIMSRFEVIWKCLGGTVAKEVHVMKLPIIRNFCNNCWEQLQSVVESVFKRITHEPPVEKPNGRIASLGPRDLFTVVSVHVSGLLPHIRGAAVLELAQFDMRLFQYFQSLYSHQLRCVHFNMRKNVGENPPSYLHRKPEKGWFRKGKNRLRAHMVILEVSEDLYGKISPTAGSPQTDTKMSNFNFQPRQDNDGKSIEFKLDEDYMVSVIGSCGDYMKYTTKLFNDMKKQMLSGTFESKSQGKEMASSIDEMLEKLRIGYHAIARSAAGVLADYWTRELEHECFGKLFSSSWLQVRHRDDESDSKQDSAPLAPLYEWWEAAIQDFAPAVGWKEGTSYLTSALIYASLDAYIRKLVKAAPSVKESSASKFFKKLVGGRRSSKGGNRVCNGLFNDLNWIRKKVITNQKKLYINTIEEALGGMGVVEDVAAFLAVEEEDQFQADANFSKLIKRLGVFGRVVVSGLVKMKTDWNKATRSEVLKRFAQYEQALEGYGGNVLIPKPRYKEESTPLLRKIRDMARVCECLRGLDVMRTALFEVHGRAGVVVAKRNKSTPWYGLTLVFYADEKTNRVSALRAGRAMSINGIDERLRQESERLQKIFNPEPGTGPVSPTTASQKSPTEDVMDVVTLEDFLS